MMHVDDLHSSVPGNSQWQNELIPDGYLEAGFFLSRLELLDARILRSALSEGRHDGIKVIQRKE